MAPSAHGRPSPVRWLAQRGGGDCARGHVASQSGSYEAGAVEAKWKSFSSGTRDNAITIRSLKRWARLDEVDQAVEQMNERYAFVLMGGSSVLVTPPNGTPDFID